jgi:hypothetical protein
MGSKNKPGAFDCYANAHPDEPMFVLLGRDRIGASLVALWADARESLGEDPVKLAEARECVGNMLRWCAHEANKAPLHALQLLPFDMLARELRRRGATVTPVAHGGDQEPPPELPAATTHVDRMRAEHSRLADDLAKLERFIGSNPIFSTLADAEQWRMERQREAMSAYLCVLVERIEAAS